METQNKKRLKSFAWRTGMMLLAVVIDQVAQNLGQFKVPTEYVVVLGLILGEVSKAINNYLTPKSEINKL